MNNDKKLIYLKILLLSLLFLIIFLVLIKYSGALGEGDYNISFVIASSSVNNSNGGDYNLTITVGELSSILLTGDYNLTLTILPHILPVVAAGPGPSGSIFNIQKEAEKPAERKEEVKVEKKKTWYYFSIILLLLLAYMFYWVYDDLQRTSIYQTVRSKPAVDKSITKITESKPYRKIRKSKVALYLKDKDYKLRKKKYEKRMEREEKWYKESFKKY